MIDPKDLEHLAFSIAHGTFNENNMGGCSCKLCLELRTKIYDLKQEEAAKFYNEHYPPAGGF